MEHIFTETYQVNFDKLESRILNAKYLENSIDKIRGLNGSTLIVCTGGSKVVGNYFKLCLELHGNFVSVIEPRDYFYMSNPNSYDNLVVISHSLRSNGLDSIINSFGNNKLVFTGSDCNYDCDFVKYEIIDREKSFISLATTLVPMKILLESFYGECSDLLIKDMLDNAKSLVQSIDYDFGGSQIIQVLSGYDSLVSQSALESSLIETGASSVVIHDKGSFCHGRSNLLYRYSDSPVIFLGSVFSDFNDLLKSVLCDYKVLDFSSIKYDSLYLEEYYKVVLMYYLSLKICLDKNIDMTMPDYDERVVKKLYSYKGGM